MGDNHSLVRTPCGAAQLKKRWAAKRMCSSMDDLQ